MKIWDENFGSFLSRLKRFSSNRRHSFRISECPNLNVCHLMQRFPLKTQCTPFFVHSSVIDSGSALSMGHSGGCTAAMNRRLSGPIRSFQVPAVMLVGVLFWIKTFGVLRCSAESFRNHLQPNGSLNRSGESSLSSPLVDRELRFTQSLFGSVSVSWSLQFEFQMWRVFSKDLSTDFTKDLTELRNGRNLLRSLCDLWLAIGWSFEFQTLKLSN